MSKLKLKTLLEGFAWERKADGSLPTLADAIAVHEANIAETEYKYAGRKVTIDKNGTEDQTKWKVKFTDSDKTVDYVDVVANITPRPKMNEPRWQDSDGDGKWYEPEDVNESAYKNSTNNELASHIGQLKSELKSEKDPKKQAIIRKDLEACKSELASRKQNEGLTPRDLDLIAKFKKNLNESARRY